MMFHWNVILDAEREEKPSSVAHDIEQWSIIQWFELESPIPSDTSLTPESPLSPGRTRISRIMTSSQPSIPNPQCVRVMPSPGAVWPATYTSPPSAGTVSLLLSCIIPPTSNTIVLEPLTSSSPYLSEPSPESLRFVTW